jgi:hypothetical protein
MFRFKPVLFTLLQVGGLSTIAIAVPLVITPSAHAQSACVMMDINLQLGMHGTQSPSTQINDANMAANNDCYSGASVLTNTQTAVTPGPITQVRSSDATIDSRTPANLTGIPGLGGGPAIMVPVNVQIDLYNPALDNNFQSGLKF